MFPRTPKLLLAGFLSVFGTAGLIPSAKAQQPPEGVEVLARGPVHEAFASTAEQPKPTPVINRRPPEPVEELPPDQKPDGENVLWIPGYWHYDEQRTDFIWISGFWRAAPPGRVWVPGSWREAAGGHQWVQGFWQDAAPATGNRAQEPMIEYLPEPPQPLEFAPSIPAPDTSSFYVSGSWVWRGRYVWRPGFWIAHRPGWCWTPACYRWTPAGFVFVDGFWDYPLAARGTLFAPVAFRPGIFRPGFFFTPTFIVNEPCLHTSLFVRRGWGNYYFGDFFAPTFVNAGFNPWFGPPVGSGFAIGVTFGARPFYDPLWNYYRLQNLNNPGWAVGINNVFIGRFNGTVPRPPVTLVQQTTIINNITNVTNNTVVNNNTTTNNNVNNVNNLMMVSNLKDASKSNANIVLKPVAKEQLAIEQSTAKELRNVAAQRQRLETRLAQTDGIPKLAPAGADGIAPQPKIQAIQLDAPKQAIARAQMPKDERKAPPPSPERLKINANPAVNNAKPIAPAMNPKPGNAVPANPVNPTPTPKPGTPLPRGGEAKPINPAPNPKPGNPLPTTPPKGEPNPVTPVKPAPVPVPKPGNPMPNTPPKGDVNPIKPAPAPSPKPGNPPPQGNVNPAVPVPTPKPNTPPPLPRGEVKPINPAPQPAPVIKPPASNPTPQPAPVIKLPAATPAPRIEIKPSTPAPRQIAPPQPAPRQIAPPQPAPRQISPPPSISPAPKPAPPSSGGSKGGNSNNRRGNQKPGEP